MSPGPLRRCLHEGVLEAGEVEARAVPSSALQLTSLRFSVREQACLGETRWSVRNASVLPY